jgi:hypothetical protein
MRKTGTLFIMLILCAAVRLTAQDCPGQQAYTPDRGTQERKAVLDALREEVYGMHGIRVVFVVRYMKVCDGWAWVHTQPRSADGKEQYEDILALIGRSGDDWQVLEIPCVEEENPDCINSENYFEGLKKRFPGLPANILPAW